MNDPDHPIGGRRRRRRHAWHLLIFQSLPNDAEERESDGDALPP